jgi:hypothetical protein
MGSRMELNIYHKNQEKNIDLGKAIRFGSNPKVL